MGVRAFMHATKKGDAFLIYALLAIDVKSQQHEISSQYKAYKDVFERKNVNILLEYQPYDCTIDLEEGVEPPFTTYHKMNF
jgi:hypothetical protein